MVLWNAAEKLVEDVNSASGTFAAEVAVVGGGPAGLVSAIALAAAGVDTLVVAPRAAADHRTTALLSGSVTALETLGAWPACLPHAAALKKLRIVDVTGRIFRAPEVHFAAGEIGLDAFGYNIENRYLLAALEARAAELNLPRIEAPALAVAPDAGGVTIDYAGGTRGCGSRLEPTASGRCAAPRPVFRRSAKPIRRSRSRSISRTPARTTTPQPNSTPKAARSRSFPCPASGQVLSACSSRRAPPSFRP